MAPGIKHPTRPGEPPRFYHGTTREFSEGDLILPSNLHGHPPVFPDESSPQHAYATAKEDDAWWYAEHAWGAGADGECPRVYRVEPIGLTEHDPRWDGQRNRGTMEHDVRSQHGFRVLYEMPMPEYMGDPDDWA